MDGKYFTSFDGSKIFYHYRPGTPGKCLIFLHGLGGDLTAWENERRYFDKLNISTIAIDLRGHGKSARGENKDFYKLENFAKDVVALIEFEKLANVVLVGHCFGGMVAIYTGANFSAQTSGLVLVDTGYKPPFFGDNLVEKFFLKFLLDIFAKHMPGFHYEKHIHFHDFLGTSDVDVRRILSDILHTSLRSYLLICNALIGYDARDLLRKILVPSLVIEGTMDSVFPPKIAEYLQSRIKRSELDLIEGANHILVLNDPIDLEKSIDSFLRKVKFLS